MFYKASTRTDLCVKSAAAIEAKEFAWHVAKRKLNRSSPLADGARYSKNASALCAMVARSVETKLVGDKVDHIIFPRMNG